MSPASPATFFSSCASVYCPLKRAGPFGREGAFAVERVVGVDGAAVLVGRDGNAAAEMADDEVEVFISLPYLLREAVGDGPLVQGVPDADARHDGRTADTGQRRQLVHHARVGDEAAAVGYLACYLIGDETPQVAGVLVDGVLHVVEHAAVDFIHAAGHGLGEPAAADDGVEIEVDVHAFKLVEHQLLAETVLAGDGFKLCQLFCGVGDGAQHHRTGVFVHRHLGRCRAWIDDKDFHNRS